MATGWYVYMLRCADGSLYTGVTTDPERRLREHNEGRLGARYTRARRPVELVYLEEVPDRAAAGRREASLKKLPRPQKLTLVADKGVKPCRPARAGVRQSAAGCGVAPEGPKIRS